MKPLITLAVVIAALSSIAVAQQRGKNSKGQRNPNGQDAKTPIVQLIQEEPVNWGFVLLTDNMGTHTIRAKPLSLADGKVTLKMRNGHVATVALSQLSKTDQDLLSETFVDRGNGDAGESTGAEFLKDALIRASETFPDETQVRRDLLVKGFVNRIRG